MAAAHLFLPLGLTACLLSTAWARGPQPGPRYVQTPAGTIRVEVQSAAGAVPVPGAVVTAAKVTVTANVEGVAVLSVPAGRTEISVTHEGFLPGSAIVDVIAAQEHIVRIVLAPRPTVEEEVTVVATTRTGRRVEDQPMRVEVLGREEIEEKMLMTPGDIVMMLNEMGGLRVQATSPSLGAASVRIQGMRGRYTQFLSDGLPLFGEQPGGLGLLQIPPMDLGQVEVIKGVASALYGAGAMGGVINLLSRRPGDDPEREILFNQSTRGATDGVFWLSTPFAGSWGLTLLASGHYQKQTDVDDDGWADLANYQRGVVRPRLFWDNKQGRSFFATAGLTTESRRGGTVSGGVIPATGEPYEESLDTTRIDAGVSGQTLVAGRYVFTARAAFSGQGHDHLFGDVRERDRHDTAFAEAAWRGSAGRHTWVAGFAIEHDSYDPEDVPRFKYAFTTPGIFVQDDIDLTKMLIVSASGRVDWHSEYGTFFSPRVSLLLRAASSRGSGEASWSSRVSIGGGFFAPTPLTEETEAAGLTRLTVPAPLTAERGRSFSVDFSRTDGPLSWTFTYFASRIGDPLHVDREETYTLRTLDGETTNHGVELLATFRRSVFVATGTYTYVQSRESDAGVRTDVPLTPRHSAGFVAMAESEERGRVGLEIYFTGRQRLEANPLRTVSEPYVIIGLLGEHRFGRFSLFINGENLTGVRQSSWDPLVRSSRASMAAGQSMPGRRSREESSMAASGSGSDSLVLPLLSHQSSYATSKGADAWIRTQTSSLQTLTQARRVSNRKGDLSLRHATSFLWKLAVSSGRIDMRRCLGQVAQSLTGETISIREHQAIAILVCRKPAKNFADSGDDSAEFTHDLACYRQYSSGDQSYCSADQLRRSARKFHEISGLLIIVGRAQINHRSDNEDGIFRADLNRPNLTRISSKNRPLPSVERSPAGPGPTIKVSKSKLVIGPLISIDRRHDPNVK